MTQTRLKSTLVDNVDKLTAWVNENDVLVVPADYGGAPSELARALIRANKTGLTLMGGPPCGYVADLLIGAGCIANLEVAGVILGDFGLAPRFRAGVESGRVRIRETTCPAFHSSILAGQKGLPFMPMRGLIGSDVLCNRPDWKIVSNPYADDEDPIVMLPALTPDVVMFHARYGDRHGNVWVGKAAEVIAMAQAAKVVIATFEHFFEGDLLDHPSMAPATVSSLYVTATAHSPKGAWPIALANEYPVDVNHMATYAKMARSDEEFEAYLREFVRPRGSQPSDSHQS